MSLMSPAGLWALLALAIPLLIHLFNRSRGRLVRIGHIDLIRKARRLRVTEVKLAQWLLLMLRLGIFTLAALLLAGLAQMGLDRSGDATIYVTPAWIRTVSAEKLEVLFKETSQDTRMIVLQSGFAALDRSVVKDIRQTPLDESGIENIWPLLAERLSLEHHTGTVNVYATDYAQQFGHTRSDLPGEVSWNISHPESIPLFKAWPSNVVLAYDRDRKQDADYFVAALASLKASRIPDLTWQQIGAEQLSQQHLDADWLIFLSESRLANTQLARLQAHATLLMDAPAVVFQDSNDFVTLPLYPFSTFRLNGLFQNPQEGQPILVTAQGWPVLQQMQSGAARILQFNSRFNPRFSSITQLPEFPELLLQLMLNDEQKTGAYANARINPQQLRQGNFHPAADIPLPRRSLQSLLAMLLALLWITERWLSERRQNEPR